VFSIATNVSLADTQMIGYTVANWLRVFGDRVQEVVVVADLRPLSGRIARQHEGRIESVERLMSALHALCSSDRRVRTLVLNGDGQMAASARRWFGVTGLVRCQDGTPVGPMVHAIEMARGPLVLRADCDMLFCENGWLAEGERLLRSGEVDVLEPPRLGMSTGRLPGVVSTRAILVLPERLGVRLPLRTHRLDPLRGLHRRLQGRPPWVSLETMLERAKSRGRIVHRIMDETLGFSLHVYTREHALRAGFSRVIAAVEAGRVPEGQPAGEWNLVLETT
jgi:hypothetical protein